MSNEEIIERLNNGCRTCPKLGCCPRCVINYSLETLAKHRKDEQVEYLKSIINEILDKVDKNARIS